MTWLDLLTNPAATAAAASIATAFAGLLVARANKAPDVQTALATATEKLIALHSKALSEATAEVAALRKDVAALRGKIDELEAHIDALTTELVNAGIDPPPRER